MPVRLAILVSVVTLRACLAWGTEAKAASPAEEAKAPQGCSTSQCHPGLMPTKPPLVQGHGDCLPCHQGNGKEKDHPQPGTKAFVLANTDICLKCHPKIVDFDYLHPPVAAEDCLACHTFHSSAPALIKEGRDHILCYDCHQAVTREGDTQLHGEVAKQKCTSCHTVHGSFFNHLLTGSYSTEFFIDYDNKQYAFCFQCHKIDLLLDPTTSYNTNFRDGKKNLHYLHVNRKIRGRSCKLCHAIHSSRLPKLMAEKVSFGDWEMPVNFVLTENGGKCTPGCHAASSYDRTRTPLSGPQNRPE